MTPGFRPIDQTANRVKVRGQDYEAAEERGPEVVAREDGHSEVVVVQIEDQQGKPVRGEVKDLGAKELGTDLLLLLSQP